VVPEYTRCEIHYQPGGCTDDPIGGLVFHYGTKDLLRSFPMTRTNYIELAESFVARKRQVERILDVGAASGEATTVLKVTRTPK
jgi:hypothetical protein